MRILLVTTLAACLIAGCKGGTNNDKVINAALADTTRFTTVEWLDSTRDLGKVPEGKKVDVAFRFRNTGTTPLVIGQVRPSCGCTVAEQPQEPIAPGGEGQIKAVFSSEGRSGINHKTLFVTANTKGKQDFSLQFVVEVEKNTLK